MSRNPADFLTVFGNEKRDSQEVQASADSRCLYCEADLSSSESFSRYRVCDQCRFHYALPARERLDLLADPGSFKESHRTLVSLDPLSFRSRQPFRRQVMEAQRRTGLGDAVVTGTCTIGGQATVIAVLDFAFLGGTMGCVVGEKVALAFETAARKKLPLVTVATSGGPRIQEGVLSLMQMAKTAAAAKKLDAAGLPHIAVLANPTTGGVYASFANLADVILAEHNALVGFAPLRVVEQATGHPLPQGSHTAESHLRHGMIDQVVDRTRLREVLSVLLELLSSRYELTSTRPPGERYTPPAPTEETAWETVQLARHSRRPTFRHYLQEIASNFVELHGDRHFGDDDNIVCGLGDLGGQAVVFVGHQRTGDGRQEARPYPEGYRKAVRAMRLAAKFKLPLVTFIDTPGAYAGLEAEERGIGNAIAVSMATLSDLPTPVLSVIIGEGGSEGALALGVADRLLMQEHAIYSVVSPEGAASVLYRDQERAEELATALRLTAHDCRELEVVDVIVPEPEGGAHNDPSQAARLLRGYLLDELLEMRREPVKKLVKARYKKFRRMGEYSSHFGAAIAREVDQLQETVRRRMADFREHLPGGHRENDEDNEDLVAMA